MAKNIFFRKLIEIEIRLGFLHIPKTGLEFMPDNNTVLKVYINDSKIPFNLRYNAKYKRIFGLTKVYRDNGFKVGDLLRVAQYDSGYNISKLQKAIKDLEEDDKGGLDLSGLSSQAKGNIMEDRIKEIILLHGQGLLNVYKPVCDTEGIDLIITKSGIYQPLFIQVKSRYTLNNGQVIIRIKKKNLNPHHSYFLIGAYFSPKKLEVEDFMLFMPTVNLEEEAPIVKANGRESYDIRFDIHNKSKNKFSKYVIKKSELVQRLIEKFQEMERYVK